MTSQYDDIRHAIHTERHVKIICIGAGASGLMFAYKLQRHFRNYTLTVYEKNDQVGGTWWENNYPGCACDVPAHNYTWSFEPKLDWSAVYAGSAEIFAYFNNFTDKYGLRKYCRMRHIVTGAIWDASKGEYRVQIKDLASNRTFTESCHILVNGSGILNAWQWPAIPGLADYKGVLLHTANWDNTVDLAGKHVGLIGNGSSGIQVLPTIQPIVGTLTTFIREATYISPTQGQEQHFYTEEELKQFATEPGKLLQHRKTGENQGNTLINIFQKHSPLQVATRQYITQQMRDRLQNPNLAEKMIPNWSTGCRRLTPGTGYLEALGKENVTVIFSEIERITEKGCICNGKEYPVDVLICATGFDTTFKPRFPLVNQDDENLQQVWAKEAQSYLGIGAANFPNYLMFLGPNCPIGNGPVLVAIEAQADWMMAVIDRYQTTNIHSFSPKQEAVDEFIQYKNKFMKRTVWDEACRSWYKSNQIDAPVTAIWPGSTLHYIEALDEVRWDDFNVKYNGSRFAWLGNGHSQTEVDPDCDTAYYIREKDDSPFASRGRRREVLTKSGTFTPKNPMLANAARDTIAANCAAIANSAMEKVRVRL